MNGGVVKYWCDSPAHPHLGNPVDTTEHEERDSLSQNQDVISFAESDLNETRMTH